MQKYIKIILIILVPIIIYLASFGFYVYDDLFYTKLTDQYSNVPEKAERMNLYMVSYFLCSCDSPRGFDDFTEKEIMHLQDVKQVIKGLMSFLMISAAAFIIFLSFAKEKQKIFLYGGTMAVLLPILLWILPFDFLFTHMHNIFFEKGTWVFDQNALLINLYTAEFFQAFAKTIILTGFCLSLVITFLAWISRRK